LTAAPLEEDVGAATASKGRAARAIALALVALAALPVAAGAAVPEVGQTVVRRGPGIATDLYAFGGGVDIQADVDGDLLAGGGRVVTGKQVLGNVIVAAGSIQVAGHVVRSVRAAGGAITISGHVGRNLSLAGGSVVITPEARIDGRARVAGGEVRVAGVITRKLHAVAAVIVLAGEIQGDVDLVAQEIEVLPTASIKGNLTYWSPRDARIDPKAKIQGTVTHNLPELPRTIARTGTALFTVQRILFMMGLMVLGIALYLLFPGFTVLASRTIGSDPIKSLALGVLLATAVPVAAILSMLTILGIPLGLIIFVIYSVALLAGFLLTAFHLGDVGAHALLRKGARSRPVRVAFLVAALAVLLLARQVPYVGGAVVVVAVLVGLGALSVHVWRHWGDPESPARRRRAVR
jgi:cytoskeletal protein CcmA (bactofilin family)